MSELLQPDFIQIPTQLLSDKKLRSGDRVLYGYIYWMTKLALLKCVASNEYLSRLTNFSARSIQNSLTRLEKQGYVRRIYADEQHKNRLEIICLIAYSNVSSNDDRRVIKRAHEVSSNDDHNKNNSNNIDLNLYREKRKSTKEFRQFKTSAKDAEFLVEEYAALISNGYEGWYLKAFMMIGKERIMILASQAKNDGNNSQKLFSHLLKEELVKQGN